MYRIEASIKNYLGQVHPHFALGILIFQFNHVISANLSYFSLLQDIKTEDRKNKVKLLTSGKFSAGLTYRW